MTNDSGNDVDSGEDLTGGYGGDREDPYTPTNEDNVEDEGSTEADDLGSTSMASGLTAGGTDTAVAGTTGSIDGYSDTNLRDVEGS